MRMGEGSKRVMIDRGVAVGDIDRKSLAGIERAVRIVPFDRLGQFGVVEGKRGIVPAISGVSGHRDVVEREIIDLLRCALADL